MQVPMPRSVRTQKIQFKMLLRLYRRRRWLPYNEERTGILFAERSDVSLSIRKNARNKLAFKSITGAYRTVNVRCRNVNMVRTSDRKVDVRGNRRKSSPSPTYTIDETLTKTQTIFKWYILLLYFITLFF